MRRLFQRQSAEALLVSLDHVVENHHQPLRRVRVQDDAVRELDRGLMKLKGVQPRLAPASQRLAGLARPPLYAVVVGCAPPDLQPGTCIDDSVTMPDELFQTTGAARKPQAETIAENSDRGVSLREAISCLPDEAFDLGRK